VAGRPFIAAQALLEDRGFTVAPPKAGKPSGQKPDVVLFQDPAGDIKAPKGSVVTLTVDPGVVVPNLLNPQVAGIPGIQALTNAGVEVGDIAFVCKGTPNMIFAQAIDPKTRVALGTKVNITIASANAGMKTCLGVADKAVMNYKLQAKPVGALPQATVKNFKLN